MHPTPDSARAWWEQLRLEYTEEGIRTRQANDAIVKLGSVYGRLKPDVRIVVDEVIAEWLLSDDLGKRFDARSLVSTFKIKSAVGSLKILAVRLADAPTIAARFELKRINEILEQLEGAAS